MSSARSAPSSAGNDVPVETTIRNFRSGDEADWLALVQAAPDFPYAFLGRSPSPDALRMTVAHPWIDAANSLFFAEADGQLVGYAELWHGRGMERSTGRVLVHPICRRQGLGTRLSRCIEARARVLGSTYLDVQLCTGHCWS
jgi:GNAT superfamily N-acetyltransferase